MLACLTVYAVYAVVGRRPVLAEHTRRFFVEYRMDGEVTEVAHGWGPKFYSRKISREAGSSEQSCEGCFC